MPKENETMIEELPPKSSNKIVYLLISVIFILIIGVGVGGWLMYDKINQPTTLSQTEEKVIEEIEPENDMDGEVGHIVQFDQMIINLSSDKGKKNYLKVQINIEFRNDDSSDLYNSRKPLLFDALLTAASSKSKEELMTIGGKEELKMELKEEFNDIMGKKIVKNIYWKTFVIQ